MYKTDLKANSTFQFPTQAEANIQPDQFLLDEAQIILGINDLKGIEGWVIFNWANTSLALKPGTGDISFN